jgi:hypothetical protein
MSLGSYGVYWTYYDAPVNNLPKSQVGCKVVGVEDGGAVLVVQPMIQGANSRLKENRGGPIQIPVGDFVEMPQLAPIGAGHG